MSHRHLITRDMARTASDKLCALRRREWIVRREDIESMYAESRGIFDLLKDEEPMPE